MEMPVSVWHLEQPVTALQTCCELCSGRSHIVSFFSFFLRWWELGRKEDTHTVEDTWIDDKDIKTRKKEWRSNVAWNIKMSFLTYLCSGVWTRSVRLPARIWDKNANEGVWLEFSAVKTIVHVWFFVSTQTDMFISGTFTVFLLFFFYTKHRDKKRITHIIR